MLKGTRITIGDILQWLASGMSVQEILDDFPLLKEEHIRAALAFAANREACTKEELMKSEEYGVLEIV